MLPRESETEGLGILPNRIESNLYTAHAAYRRRSQGGPRLPNSAGAPPPSDCLQEPDSQRHADTQHPESNRKAHSTCAWRRGKGSFPQRMRHRLNRARQALIPNTVPKATRTRRHYSKMRGHPARPLPQHGSLRLTGAAPLMARKLPLLCTLTYPHTCCNRPPDPQSTAPAVALVRHPRKPLASRLEEPDMSR